MSYKTKNSLTFCLESKIRHSTIHANHVKVVKGFCLESKIRHSTIWTNILSLD